MTKSLIIVVGVLSLFFILIWISPLPYLVINAETEILLYRVSRPNIAAFSIVNAEIHPLTDDCVQTLGLKANDRITALVQPNEGALVQYRWSPRSISVVIKGPNNKQGGSLTLFDERGCKLSARTRIKFQIENIDNPSSTPLPIAGPAEIGMEQGANYAPKPGSSRVFNMMHSGSIQVFGRGIFSDVLYSGQFESIQLPLGGRLTSGNSLIANPGSNKIPPWYGVAEIRDRGFHVSATTESRNIRLFRAGSHSESETVAISFMAMVVNDPTISLVTLMGIVFLSIVQLCVNWKILKEKSD